MWGRGGMPLCFACRSAPHPLDEMIVCCLWLYVIGNGNCEWLGMRSDGRVTPWNCCRQTQHTSHYSSIPRVLMFIGISCSVAHFPILPPDLEDKYEVVYIATEHVLCGTKWLCSDCEHTHTHIHSTTRNLWGSGVSNCLHVEYGLSISLDLWNMQLTF